MRLPFISGSQFLYPQPEDAEFCWDEKKMFCVLIEDYVSNSDYTTSNSKAPDKLSVGKNLK